MSLFEQDPAEAFLLQTSQVLCSPPRISWVQRAGSSSQTGPSTRPSGTGTGAQGKEATSLIPPALVSRDRELSRGDREPVARPAFAYPPSPHLPPFPTAVTSNKVKDAFDVVTDPIRRIPSPEKSQEWQRRRLATARQKRQEEFNRAASRGEVYDLDSPSLTDRKAGKPKAVELVEDEDDEHGESDEEKEMCVICLQGVRDRTVLGECGHQCFCFSCINVWSNQSRRCPLCSAAMSPFLLHKLDDGAGPVKFHLPPLPSIRPSSHTTFSSSLSSRVHVPPFRQSGPEVLVSDRVIAHRERESERWGRKRRDDGEDDLERQIERRRMIYRNGLFAKHVASNIHTRFKPIPTPRQFAENQDMIVRATSFLRRELRVWRGIDVEFLTTYIVSLMKSIDIRSEAAVRLLADFLDEPGLSGRERRGAEHFAHEVYSFLRSPYRDLTVYDAVAQYDPIPEVKNEAINPTTNDDDRRFSVSASQSHDQVPPSDHNDDIPSPSRARARSRSRSRSFSRSPSLSHSVSPSRSRRLRPPPSSPRRWDRRDSYVPPPSPSHAPRGGDGKDERKWDERDTWVSPDVEVVMEARKRKRVEERRGKRREGDRVEMEDEKDKKREVVHRGLRGWDEVPPSDVPLLPVDLVERMDVDVDIQNQHTTETQIQPTLSLKIFGRAQQRRSPTPTEVQNRDRGLSPPPREMEGVDDDYEEDPWGVDPTFNVTADAELPMDPTNDSTESNETALVEKARRREKLLGKLLREKRISARARAVLSRPNIIGENEVAERLAAADDAMAPVVPVDKEAIEARAKARLKLKLKLAKEKATMGTVDGNATVNGASSLTADPAGDKVTDGQDRAAMLRAKLMAARNK